MLSAPNYAGCHERSPLGKQRTVFYNDPGQPMSSNLMGGLLITGCSHKVQKGLLGESGIGSEFASQILLSVVSPLTTETKADSNPDFECPCSAPLRAMGYLG